MVVQVSNDTFARGSYAPAPEPSDSDDLALALETARALEAQGDTREAVRWLRRAADVAERDGNDRRVVAIAGAAADLTSGIDATALPTARPIALAPSPSTPVPPGSSIQPPAPKPPGWSLAPAVVQAGRASSSPSPSPSRIASPPPLPRPTPMVTAPITRPAEPSESDERATDRGVFRVYVKPTARDPGLLLVRQWDGRKPLPDGAREGHLVLTDPNADPFAALAPEDGI